MSMMIDVVIHTVKDVVDRFMVDRVNLNLQDKFAIFEFFRKKSLKKQLTLVSSYIVNQVNNLDIYNLVHL